MSVATLTAAAQAYVAAVTSSSDTALGQARAAVQLVGYDALSFNPSTLPTAPTVPDELTLPTLSDIGLELPAEPADTLDLQDVSPVALGTVPTFTDVAPTLNLPNLPAALPGFTAQLPAINTDIDFPEVPAALANPNLTAPVIADRSVPAVPTVALPAFEGIVPTDQPTAPTDLQTTFQNAKAEERANTMTVLDGQVDAWITKFNPQLTTQIAAIETQLNAYLAGGTGMRAAVENAIYARSQSKQSAETRRAREAAAKDAGARGFSLPPGVLIAADLQARQAGSDNNAAAAREIVVLAAEWEQKNLQFAITTSVNFRQSMIQAALSYHQNLSTINGQAIEVARSIVASLIQAYEVARQVFAVKLEVFKAQAAAYDVRVKAALAAIEIYRAEIAALEAQVTVDRAKVDLYRGQIDALQAFANVYRAQVEAVQGRASLEKLRLELFGSQVTAYRATVDAHNGELDAYRAGISGETAKVSLYESQARTFGIRMDGYRAGIDAQARAISAQAESNRARADTFRAILSKFTTIVEARGKVATTQLENQRQQVIAFQAATHAQVARFDTQATYYRAIGDITVKNGQLGLEALVKSAENKQSFNRTIAQLASTNAEISGKVAAAAVAGMTTLAAETITT